jgi:serine/threonine protein kinase
MGCILFELLTGVWPFMEENQVMMFRAHLMTPPPTLASASDSYEFVADLEAIIARALAKKPEERFQDGGQMLAALNALPAVVHRPKGSGTVAAPHTAAPGMAPVPVLAGPPAHSTSQQGNPMLPVLVVGIVVVVLVVAGAAMAALFLF